MVSEVQIPTGASVRGNLQFKTVDTALRVESKGSYVRSSQEELRLAGVLDTKQRGVTKGVSPASTISPDDVRAPPRRTREPEREIIRAQTRSLKKARRDRVGEPHDQVSTAAKGSSITNISNEAPLPLQVPHALNGLAQGVIPIERRNLGNCEVRGVAPNLWAITAKAMGFTVVHMGI